MAPPYQNPSRIHAPYIGAVVHIVSEQNACTAAVITRIDNRGGYAASLQIVDVTVFPPGSLTMLQNVPYSELHEAGSWHWIE